MMDRDVDVRLLNRERYKVNFRPGTPLRAGLPPSRLLAVAGLSRRAMQRRAGASQVQGDKWLRYVTHRARGVLSIFHDAPDSRPTRSESPKNSYEMNHIGASAALCHSAVTALPTRRNGARTPAAPLNPWWCASNTRRPLGGLKRVRGRGRGSVSRPGGRGSPRSPSPRSG